MAPLLAKKLNCSSAVNEDFNILMTFENENDDQSLVFANNQFAPFSEAIDEFMNFSANYRKRKNHGDQPQRRMGLTHHTMKLMSEKPLLVLKKMGYDSVALKSATNFALSFDTKNIYIRGHYLKFSRGLSQTPWEIEGQRLVAAS